MENLLQFVKPLSVDKKIELINNVKRTTFVYIDVILLNIILRNLITNAIKFTNENGSVTINCCNSVNINEIVISGFLIPVWALVRTGFQIYLKLKIAIQLLVLVMKKVQDWD